MDLEIRKAADTDKPAVLQIIRPVIAAGETYTLDPATPDEELLRFWFAPEKHVYVAGTDAIAGTYFIKPNQPGLGSHVANAGYIVSPDAAGKGIGRAMALHSLERVRGLGFTAMQFNFVVKSNTNAVRLWKSVGFEVIGEIPRRFPPPRGRPDERLYYVPQAVANNKNARRTPTGASGILF